MALTYDYPNRIVSSSASILDLPAFHAALRDAEDSAAAMIHPIIHTWKSLDQGGGATLVQADFINGWRLTFPSAGNYSITGNLNATIIPVAGVYVERKTSTAYITTAIGGSGPAATDIAAAVWQRILESGLSAEQMVRIIAAQAAGNATGLDSSTTTFKSLDGAKDRIVGSIVAGVRTVTTLDGA